MYVVGSSPADSCESGGHSSVGRTAKKWRFVKKIPSRASPERGFLFSALTVSLCEFFAETPDSRVLPPVLLVSVPPAFSGGGDFGACG